MMINSTELGIQYVPPTDPEEESSESSQSAFGCTDWEEKDKNFQVNIMLLTIHAENDFNLIILVGYICLECVML